MYVDRGVVDYAVNLVLATRDPANYGLADIEPLIDYGASPRASLGLVAAGRALALLRGRRYALPQDVFDVAPEVLRHRLVLSYEALAQGLTADQICARVLSTVPAPRVSSTRPAPTARRRPRPAPARYRPEGVTAPEAARRPRRATASATGTYARRPAPTAHPAATGPAPRASADPGGRRRARPRGSGRPRTRLGPRPGGRAVVRHRPPPRRPPVSPGPPTRRPVGSAAPPPRLQPGPADRPRPPAPAPGCRRPPTPRRGAPAADEHRGSPGCSPATGPRPALGPAGRPVATR